LRSLFSSRSKRSSESKLEEYTTEMKEAAERVERLNLWGDERVISFYEVRKRLVLTVRR